MSCVVGIIAGDRVLVGGDSLVADDSGDAVVRRDRKVFRKGDFVIGYAGSIRGGQVLRRKLQLPSGRIGDVAEFVEGKLVDQIRNLFEGHGAIGENGGNDTPILLAYQNRLFTIGDDFHVGESADGYDAIGCAFAYALGSLFSTGHLAPEERVRKALQAAQNYHGFVRGPFVYEWTGPRSEHLPVPDID